MPHRVLPWSRTTHAARPRRRIQASVFRSGMPPTLALDPHEYAADPSFLSVRMAKERTSGVDAPSSTPSLRWQPMTEDAVDDGLWSAGSRTPCIALPSDGRSRMVECRAGDMRCFAPPHGVTRSSAGHVGPILEPDDAAETGICTPGLAVGGGFEPPKRGWALTVLAGRCLQPLGQPTEADGEGFEPPEPCGPPAFEAGAFSRTPPTVHLAAYGGRSV